MLTKPISDISKCEKTLADSDLDIISASWNSHTISVHKNNCNTSDICIDPKWEESALTVNAQGVRSVHAHDSQGLSRPYVYVDVDADSG